MIIRALFPLLLLCAAALWPGPSPDNRITPNPTGISGRVVLADEEEYIYEVSWSIFKLGTIRIKSFRDFHAEAFIDSYEGLPMVDLHSVHFSVMDSSFYSRGSRSLEKKGEQWWGLDYHYDLPARKILIDETYQKDPYTTPTSRQTKDTLNLPDANFIDGLSIGFFPRRFVQTNQTVVVPTILYGKLGNTTFYFNRKVVDEDIDALDRPVRAVEVEGTTDVEGIFGMTGDFVGWFSDDSLGVPIKGKLKVLLGNVTVELIKWNRKGWNPPMM
jgi:hypothetical protein